jgi:hypothetical protein
VLVAVMLTESARYKLPEIPSAYGMVATHPELPAATYKIPVLLASPRLGFSFPPNRNHSCRFNTAQSLLPSITTINYTSEVL